MTDDEAKLAALAASLGLPADAAGIAAHQAMLGVPTTGILTPADVRVAARAPRCGVTQVARLASGGLSRWGIREITYCIRSRPPGLNLTADQFDAAIAQCAANWMAVVDLVFTRVNDPKQANILIDSMRGARNNFDGPNGTLAWAQLPPSSSYKGQLQMAWDGDEAFTVSRTVNGILVVNVGTHEFGHLLGLDHNTVKNQLLNAYYSEAIATPQSYDQQDSWRRYSKATAPVPTPTPSPSAGSSPRAVKVQCNDGSVWGGTLSRLP